MFNITRSKATKEFSASTCNYMLQSRISSSALETCPARHETKPCPRTRSELLSITSSALQPGVAGWIFWSQFWIPWLKLKQINQISLVHTTAQVNLLKGGGWQNHVLRVCRGVTLWDLQAQARAVLSCSSATVTKQIIPETITCHFLQITLLNTWSALPGLCMRTKWTVVRNDNCYVSVLIRAR